jgi:hypothetical protein
VFDPEQIHQRYSSTSTIRNRTQQTDPGIEQPLEDSQPRLFSIGDRDTGEIGSGFLDAGDHLLLQLVNRLDTGEQLGTRDRNLIFDGTASENLPCASRPMAIDGFTTTLISRIQTKRELDAERHCPRFFVTCRPCDRCIYIVIGSGSNNDLWPVASARLFETRGCQRKILCSENFTRV